MMALAPYRIVVKQSVLKDIRRIPAIALQRIRTNIASLAAVPVPHDAEPLSGYRGFFRIRVGPYRIVYEVTYEIRIVTIIRIGHRSSVYQSL